MHILIESNPYEQVITYKKRCDETADWNEICEGKLYTEELTKGFFPFLVEQILDSIIHLYSNSKQGKIKVVFKGPDDEFSELEKAVETERYSEQPYSELVEIEKSNYYLENARDILPEIIKVYKQRISPLITENLPNQSIIQKDLNKFTEASNDVIPICVIGNYSSGKSTFINALLGNEVLPSADKPMTAKYFKITNSKQEDRATIDFEYKEEMVNIRFDKNGYKFTSGKTDDELIDILVKELDELVDSSMFIRINKTISIINSFEKKKGEQCISDLISLSIPFGRGIWGEANSNFAIIDTPGSNSASNLDHKKVLDKAMEGLTNGLPIFVSTYDSLDTNDNMELFNQIIGMKELDSRFTIIAVNQADAARLPKEGFTEDDIDDICSQAVPKSLKSEGLYFVSSIMGLGSKVAGEFVDDGYAETYEDALVKFSSPDSRFYKQLYKYNIVPMRLKVQIEDEVEKCDNLIWANSGLLSIEREIKIFAEKYSHYNKCQQSEMFLGKVIKVSEEQLEAEKQRHIQLKKERDEELEQGKRNLKDEIEKKSEELRNLFYEAYNAPMDATVDEKLQEFINVDIKAIETEFNDRNETVNQIGNKKEKQKISASSIGSDIANNISDIFKNKDITKFKNLGSDFIRDVSNTISSTSEVLNATKKIEKETALELVKHMDKLYYEDSRTMQDTIYNASIEYWNEKSDITKNELAKIVHETDILTEEERKNLSDLIINFEELQFPESTDIIFAKSDFVHTIMLFNFRVELGDKIRINKLSESFNQKLSENVDAIEQNIIELHKSTFNDWLDKLNTEIVSKLVVLNPTLHHKNEEILEEIEKIKKLQKLKDDLAFYQRSIIEMMKWKKD